MGNYEAGDRIDYLRTFEAGLEPPTAGTRHIASLERDPTGALYIPDVGMQFSYDPALAALYRQAADRRLDP